MPSPASLEDLQDRRPLTDVETAGAYALLEQAWAILCTRLPALEARMTAGAVSQIVVRSVIVAMVMRVLDNPRGYRQGSRTIDDFTESWTFDNAVSTGALYATPEEVALLGPADAQRAAFTIRQIATGRVFTQPYGDWPCLP